MSGTIFTIIMLLIGVGIVLGGGVYLKKEWADKESRKIYGVISIIGLAIVTGVVIKIIAAGF